jgi:hypothetical protein
MLPLPQLKSSSPKALDQEIGHHARMRSVRIRKGMNLRETMM